MLLSLLLSAHLVALAPAQSGPDEEYQFLVGLADKGLNEMVVEEATGFLGRYPRHAKADPARYRLGLALFELGRLDEAAPHFGRLMVAEGFEFAPEAALRFGQCRLAADAFPEAAAAFEQVLASGSDYLELPATFLLGEALFRAEDFAAAEQNYLRVLELPDPQAYDRDALAGAAWCAFRLGNFDAAAERAARFEAAHPGDAQVQELRFLAGEARLEQGNAGPALAAYASVDGGPFADAALRGAGFAAAALDRPGEAADWFGRVLAEHPDSRFRAEAALQQGIQLLRAERAEEALAVLTSGATGGGAEAAYWRGVAQARTGDAEAALASYADALAAGPGEELAGRLRTARGDALYELGRLEEAAESYRSAESDYALHAAVVSSLNDGRHAEAAELAGRLLEEYPDSRYAAQTHLARGEALLRLGQPADAEAAFLASLDGESDAAHRARAISRLGWCRYLQEDPSAAAVRFAAVVEEHPASAEAEEAAYMEGRARYESGDAEGAAAAWTRYLERHPEGGRVSEVMFRLGRLAQGADGLARLEQLIAAHEGSAEAPKALYELGERLYAEGRVAEAEAKFMALLGAHPRHELAPAAGYALAWCQYDLGRPEDAAALLPQIAEGAAAAGDAELQRAALELAVWASKAAGEAADSVRAYRAFAAAGADAPARVAAAKVAAAALGEDGGPAAGHALLVEVLGGIEQPALRGELEVERCYLALDAGLVDEASAAARAALAAAPGAAAGEAAFFVAEAWFETGDDGAAVPLYALAADAEGNPVADRALYKKGYAELRGEDAAAAATSFARLLEEHPASVLRGESLFLHGEALFRLGRHAEAVAPLSRLREELPEHEAVDRALFRLGLAQCQTEAWADASATLAELARRFPEFANGTEGELWRGRALAALDQRREARQAFERVIARDQGVLAARARLGLGKLSLAAGEVDAALSEFLKVAVLFAHDAEVSEGLYFAGLCLERLGDADRAADQYREVIAQYPSSPYAAQARERLKQLES